MQATSRREFLRVTSGATAGMASWLALGRAPAFAQKRELTFLSWNHFVPASDDELRKQADAFGKLANCEVRVDTIAHLQLPAKFAAEAQAQSGHDLRLSFGADPFLYENLLADVGDIIDELGKKYGGWYPFAKEGSQTASGWKAVPWFWISFPATYNMTHFKQAGLETPKTWAELLHHGKILKKQGNPAGIHSAPPINLIAIWKFSKNVQLAKDFVRFLFQKENYDAWIVASNAFNHPPLKHLADHPIWARNPKFAMLPKEAEYAHERGWPAKPNAAVQLIQVNYVLPDMVAKAVNGMPTKRAMAWAEDQIKLAVQGKLREAGA